MARVVRPGGRVVDPRDHHAARGRRCSTFYLALVRPRRAAASARVAGDSDAYTYLPELGASASRGPHELAAAMDARRARARSAGLLTAGGIIAIHAGRKPPEA